MQTVSSMQTSINTSKLPAIWKKLNLQYIAKSQGLKEIAVVDYGCGRAATVRQVKLFLMNTDENVSGIVYWPYDPYWGDIDANRNAISCLCQWKTADLCVCANVLNVIDDTDEMIRIIKEVTQAKYWIFQIYEGDKTAKEKYTKNGTCYQRNTRTNSYALLFEAAGVYQYYIKGNYITNSLDIIK